MFGVCDIKYSTKPTLTSFVVHCLSRIDPVRPGQMAIIAADLRDNRNVCLTKYFQLIHLFISHWNTPNCSRVVYFAVHIS